MRNVILGSFVGFVLAAAFLAACGGSSAPGGSGGPPAVSTPSKVIWSAPSAIQTVFSETVPAGSYTTGSVVYDNGPAGARDQYADFEISASGGTEWTFYLAASLDGSTYPDMQQDPGAIGKGVFLSSGTTAVFRNVRLPPSKFKIGAMHFGGGAFAATVRMHTYSAEGQ